MGRTGSGPVSRPSPEVVTRWGRIGVGGVLSPLPGGTVGRDTVEGCRRTEGADAEVLRNGDGPLAQVGRTPVAAVVRVSLTETVSPTVDRRISAPEDQHRGE